jgi:hypothetical protein
MIEINQQFQYTCIAKIFENKKFINIANFNYTLIIFSFSDFINNNKCKKQFLYYPCRYSGGSKV